MEMVHFIPPSQRRLALLAAQADSAPVLISGASGTGKGAISRWIHSHSPRSTKPYVVATQDPHRDEAPSESLAKLLQRAQGGTLHVSEVGEWPLSEQRVLLQFLNTRTIQRDGTPMLLNVRVIATTDQGLEGRAEGGLFNSGLLERLNVFRIEMPALARRSAEFAEIAQGIVHEITREIHREHVRGIGPEALAKLAAYDWPGNLRELRNVLRVAVVAARGDRVEETDLPRFGHERVDFRATREEFERSYLIELLKTFDWQIDTTCRMTRMDPATLKRKMQQYGIRPEGPSSP